MHEDHFEELAGVTVERSVDLPSPPETIWDHLVDGELLGEWMGGRVEITPRPGGPITLTPDDGAEVWGTVEEVVPGRRLQWSWRSDEGMPSQVEIELTPREDGSEMTVRETLLPWRVSGLGPQWVDPPRPEVLVRGAA